MIEVRKLWRHYGDHAALRDLSFTLARGEAVGLLGPNGAGKTTALRILAGLLAPTGGEVRIDGKALSPGDLDQRRLISYLPEQAAPYPEMRVHEYLAFRAALRELDREEIERALERCHLKGRRNSLIGQLSKGLTQRVALAAALLGSPPVLLLDEATTGLDPSQILETRHLVEELKESSAILLSTHVLREVEAVCDRVLLLKEGELVASGPMDELLAMERASLLLRCRSLSTEKLHEELASIAIIRSHTIEVSRKAGITVRVEGDGSDACAAALSRCVSELGGELLELRPVGSDLESFFETHTKEASSK